MNNKTEQKIKVLFVTSSGAPTGMYGGSVALLNLARGIRPWVEAVFVFPERGMLVDALESEGFECHILPKYTLLWHPKTSSLKACLEYVPRLLNMLRRRRQAIRRLSVLVRQVHPGIIHTNVGPLDIGYEVARRQQIPHVWHLREYQDLDFNARPFPSMKAFCRKIHQPGNTLVAITRDVARHFDLRDGQDSVIYDGVFALRDRMPECGPDTEHPHFLFTGSIRQSKGVTLLLKAFAMYCSMGGLWNLDILGEGDDQTYNQHCRQLVAEGGLTDRVHWLGFRTDVGQCMQRAMAQIVPSRNEGFGFITAEAMQNACLVLGRNTGGTREQMDNGLRRHGQEIALRFDNAEDLAALMFEIEHRGIAAYGQMVRLAFETANALYSIENVSRDILGLYNRILCSEKS